MDPISVVGFIALVVQLIDVTSKVTAYFNDVKNAPKDREKLTREAIALLALLKDLRYRVEETTSTDPWFIGLMSLGEPFVELKNTMEDIADKLAPATGLKKVLRWTLDKKQVYAALSQIERLKTIVGFAIQKDHFKLSLGIQNEITSGFQIGDRLQTVAVGFQELRLNYEVEKINQWLNAPLPTSNYNTVMKMMILYDGCFLQSKQYRNWKIGTNSFIWLYGVPGCGKTFFFSTIVQDLRSQYLFEPTIAVVYFYFNFLDPDKQRTEMLIRSLIIQLAAQCSQLPESLRSAHSRFQSEQIRPTIEELTTLLHQMLKGFNSTYILLDALDECTIWEDLLDFIEALTSWNINNLHVLATSREKNDIATALEPLITDQLRIPIGRVDSDLRAAISERLSNDPELKKWPVNIQKEIEDVLTKGADGMFRWAELQLVSLRKCITLDAIRKTLNTLPKTLNDTYEKILFSLVEEYEEDALKVFQWLCFSTRPIRLVEMVDVLAVDLTSNSDFRPEQRLADPFDILTIGSTFVSVDTITEKETSTQTTESQVLKLAHFSVHEYLISDRLKNSSMSRYHTTPLSANVSIAKTCLTYLLHFESPTILGADFDYEFPLIRYAAEFWPWHYRQITDGIHRQEVDILGFKLVESKIWCFINWLRIFNPHEPWISSDLNQRTPSPLYCMSYLGVSGVVRLLLNKAADINSKDEIYGSALSAASSEGHEDVVLLLLERGANVNDEGGQYHGPALSVASFCGHEKVVRLLLKNGADVNAEGGHHGHALSAASYEGHEEVVQLLLENGAYVNAHGGTYSNALSAALLRGHEKIARSLLEKGANVNAKGTTYSNALSAASRLGYDTMLRLLLEKGANINAEDGSCGHALSVASDNGREKVVRLFLKKGANVNAKDGIYGNALLAASDRGHKEVVRFLLENGANVNGEGGVCGNALSAASESGHEEVVILLLGKGARVDAEGGLYGNALSAASARGHEGIVRLLMDKGAHVNGVAENAGSALLAASYEGHEKIVRLLLEKGANVNAESETYGNALSAASEGGHEEVVQLLLEKGAKINATGGMYGSALSAASNHGHKEVVRLLLEKGADFITTGAYGNALSAASDRGHEEVVRLLLEKRADVDAAGKTYGNALSAASNRGHEEVVRLLLDNGAKVNFKCETYGNPLSAASCEGHEDVVQLLLERGANINAQSGRALLEASKNGQEAIMRLLLESKADVHMVFHDKVKVLHGTSVDDHEAVIQLLLKTLRYS